MELRIRYTEPNGEGNFPPREGTIIALSRVHEHIKVGKQERIIFQTWLTILWDDDTVSKVEDDWNVDHLTRR